MTTRTQAPAARKAASAFGRLLKQWRERRRLSQLALMLGSWTSSDRASQLQGSDVRNRRWVVIPSVRRIDVQLDPIAVRIVEVNRLRDGVVVRLDDQPGGLQFRLGLAQLVDAVADLEGDVEQSG